MTKYTYMRTYTDVPARPELPQSCASLEAEPRAKLIVLKYCAHRQEKWGLTHDQPHRDGVIFDGLTFTLMWTR